MFSFTRLCTHPDPFSYVDIDGAYFGTTFPHLFFLEYPELKPSASEEKYVPRVFGFQLHETSHELSLDAKLKSKQKEAESKV